MYTLFFDTDEDITPSIANRYNAKLIKMPYQLDGKEITPYVDFDEFDAHGFYSNLREIVAKNKELPTTSALSSEEYRKYFEPVLADGKDILYVHFSSKMSATFNNVEAIKKELLEKYPTRRIELIDTLDITIGCYSLCIQIGELYNKGKSMDEIIAWSKENVKHQALYFFADDLKFFAKSGRVSGFQAFMGGMIGIKPIIYVGDEGKMVSIDKGMGRKKTLDKLLKYVVDLEENIKDYPVIIATCDADELALKFVDMLKKQFGEDLKYELISVNPTIGGHCGPDAIGIAFHAKHR